MAQLRFPQTAPGFVRLECTYEGELGWTLKVTEAETKGLVHAASTQEYSFLAWDEIADVVAAVLDGVVSGA